MQAIRQRMEETGEKYTEARRAVLGDRHPEPQPRGVKSQERRIWEPPHDVLPVPVACDCVLARTERVAVAAACFAAYPTCVEFLVCVWGVRRPGEEVAHLDMSLAWAGRVRDAGPSAAPPDILRLDE